MKLLIVGLDGATWDLIGPWADTGQLPLFRKLREEAAWGPLRSVTPNLTPPGWTTAFTGVNPGGHGIYDFFAMEPGAAAPRVVSSADRKAPALWEILGYFGIPTGVCNVPSTYPADRTDCFMLTGMGTPGFHGAWAEPPSARELIRKEFPEFRFGADYHLLEAGDYAGYLEQLEELTGMQEQAALRMAKEYGAEVLLFVYDDIDRVMHFFWHFMEGAHPRHEEAPERIRSAILHYYQRVEAGIGRLMDAAGSKADLCILSDHGFGPLYTDVFLNRALADWGYLTPLSLARELVRKPLWKRAAKKVMPGAARTWLRRHVKASPLGNPIGFVDWERTRAVYSSVSGRSVHINLKGRQPHGIVEPGAQYEALRTELIERLKGLRDPETGDPVAKEVYRREEVFSGLYIADAPDLLIQEDGRYAYRVDWSESLFAPASQYGIPKTGSHRPDGILALAGPSFAPRRIEGARLEDMTPTLLALLGLPAGDRMDGRVLAEAFRAAPSMDIVPYGQLRGGHVTGLSGEDEAAVADRLKGLGYM